MVYFSENILNEGLKQLGGEPIKIMPVEKTQLSSLKQEASRLCPIGSSLIDDAKSFGNVG